MSVGGGEGEGGETKCETERDAALPRPCSPTPPALPFERVAALTVWVQSARVSLLSCSPVGGSRPGAPRHAASALAPYPALVGISFDRDQGKRKKKSMVSHFSCQVRVRGKAPPNSPGGSFGPGGSASPPAHLPPRPCTRFCTSCDQARKGGGGRESVARVRWSGVC